MPARARVIGETAAHHLVREVATADPADTVADALARLRASGVAPRTDALYLVDRTRAVLGLVPLAELVAAAPHARLRDLMRPAITVHPHTDQERVASRALRHGITSVAVVDRAGVLLGSVPARALLEILRGEHVEDLHRLAGIRRETRHARAALEEPPARRAHHRLPWLIAGLALSTLSVLLVSRFAAVLEARIAVAFFIPGIVYLADAIGTQTEAVTVRGLSLTDAGIWRTIRRELETGLLLGLALGTLAFAGILLFERDLRLSLAVGLTVVAAGATATGVGVGLPALLARLGRDPAFGSGPLATIIQDVLTLLIYFVIATALL